MDNQQQHEMVLEITHPSGVEGWVCPTCGRRMLIDWEPKFKKIVLETGDAGAIHSASKGGLQIGPLQVSPEDAPVSRDGSESSSEDPRLAPWLAWLKKTGFENLWNDEI